MSHLGLLTLSLFLCFLSRRAAGEVFYITITDHGVGGAVSSTDCSTAVTLSQFATNSSQYLRSNTTLVFFPGTHNLSNVNLTLSNVDKFVMKSENSMAQIKCAYGSSMYFYQSRYIHITNLEFIGCGGNQVSQVEEFVVEDAKFKGQENSGTSLELIRTRARIVNSSFISNRKGTYRDSPIFHRRSFGGAVIATNSPLDITHSKFEGI